MEAPRICLRPQHSGGHTVDVLQTASRWLSLSREPVSFGEVDGVFHQSSSLLANVIGDGPSSSRREGIDKAKSVQQFDGGMRKGEKLEGGREPARGNKGGPVATQPNIKY